MTRPATDAERVAIVGSRQHPDCSIVRAYVRTLPPGTVVVSGGADGVDTVAEQQAMAFQMTVVSFRISSPVAGPTGRKYPAVNELRHYPAGRGWVTAQTIDLYGASDRDALIFRNTLIALADRMVVFPDGSKGGCWDAAREAVRFKRPVEVRWADGRVVPFTGQRDKPAGPVGGG